MIKYALIGAVLLGGGIANHFIGIGIEDNMGVFMLGSSMGITIMAILGASRDLEELRMEDKKVSKNDPPRYADPEDVQNWMH